jgi:hypothetical protein
VKKINELVATSNKLTNNFVGLVTVGLGPNVGRGPPVVPHCARLYIPRPTEQEPFPSIRGWRPLL